MALFKGFKPEAMNKIASAMGYQGNMNEFQEFIEEDPQRQEQMNKFTQKAQEMARGGVVKMQTGGTTTGSGTGTGTTKPTPAPQIAQDTVARMYTPGLPIGAAITPAQIQQNTGQLVGTGGAQLTGSVAVPTAQAATAQAPTVTQTATNTMQAAQAAPAVDAAMQATQAAQANPQDPRAQVTAAQQTTSSVGNLQAAQGNASLINNPVQLSLIHI